MSIRHRQQTVAWLACFVGICLPAASFAQLRVATWNVTNYSSGRVSEFQTALYGVYEGRSLTPDVLLGQEFLSATGVNNYLSLLNSASGSPGDWAAAPFVDGPDTDSAFFYRTSKVDFLGYTIVAVGGTNPTQPRNIMRYDVRLKDYAADSAVLACYSSHMKAGTGTDDQARRLVEAQLIRGDAETLNADWEFLLGGDFNIQTSTQAAYQELIGSQANNDGRFFDPIARPGSWNNNSTFAVIHTQDPAGAGGMDDRHDQLLLSEGLIDGAGFDYIGDPTSPYNLSDWNDLNHSYRSWGNDGTCYNTTLTITGNEMVGATIAQALYASASGAGHLPVFLDLMVPPEVDSDTVIDFGQVPQGSSATELLDVWNAGDVALWTEDGIADLEYSLATSAGFTAPSGTFADAAGGATNGHTIEMDTSTIGVKNGVLTISSNAPDEPARQVTLTGEVVAAYAPGDLNCDGAVNNFDIDPFVLVITSTPPGYAQYYAMYPECDHMLGDCNGDGSVNNFDIDAFVGLLN